MKENRLFILILLLFLSINVFAIDTLADDSDGDGETENTEQKATVEKFRNILSFKFSLGYNFMLYEQNSLDYNLMTNRPLDLGIGLSLFSFSIGFTLTLPFYDRDYWKSQSFDISFNNFNKKNTSFSEGYFKYYRGFHDAIEGDIPLEIINAGLSRTFIFNKNHSLRSIYNLDGRQTVSNGSFLIGVGAFFSSIYSESEILSYYSKRQNTFYTGPSLGYSYIWILKDNFFLNVLSTFGANLIIHDWEASFGFQALPKFSFGYNSKTWSASIYINASYLYARLDEDMEYHIVTGNAGLTFIKRLFNRGP